MIRSVPSNLPQPGSPGGGGLPLPTTSDPNVANALTLVPRNLSAVAIFPPFETVRTLPTVGAIFSEPGSVNYDPDETRSRGTYLNTFIATSFVMKSGL